MNLGAQLKQEGIEQVMEGESETWFANARGLFRRYMRAHPHGFTAEQCKVFALSEGLPTPHHPNVWGGIWSTFAKSKSIIKTGRYVRSELPARHANEVPEWCIADHF